MCGFRLPRRRSLVEVRSVPVVAVAALLVFASLPGLAFRSVAKEPALHPAAELFVADGPCSGTLLPLDAGTLEFPDERPEVSAASADGWPPLLSADGSTLVTVEAGRRVAVHDGMFGPERVRIDAEGDLGKIFLSRDGARLVVSVWADASGAGLRTPAWKVFDTGSGSLLTTVESETPEQWALAAVDADAERLYRLTLTGATPTDATGPVPTRLIAHDLLTGEESGRLDLPAVRAGFWQGEEIVEFENGGREPLSHSRVPGVALSPDGARLAIAHADDDGLTLIDTATLTVERTRSIAKSKGLLSRLAGLIPLLPQSASAKAMEGTDLIATFSPDGSRLYLTGTVASVEDGVPSYRGLGLRAIDVESAEIAEEALDGVPLDQVVPSPDGGSLYVSGWAAEATNANPNPPYVIRRLDTATLEVVAERSFPTWRPFLVRSALTDSALPLSVELAEMAFVPQRVVAPAGTAVELVLTNHDAIAHNFTANDEAGHLDVRVDLAPGETKTVTIEAATGEYKMFCAVAGHPEAGMGGILVVTGDSAS